MHRDLPRLEKSELFARLRQGHGARLTVLAPNRRLAQALMRDYDLEQAGGAWETPDILPFGAFVARLWEDALYSSLASQVPLLLTPAQDEALWEDAIAGTRHAAALFSTAAAAAQAREAWQVLHAWRINSGDPGSEDARAFAEWSSRYARATDAARQTDAARLPDVMAPHLGHAALRKPATLVLYGFDLVTPQMRDFVTALGTQGCAVFEASPPARASRTVRVELVEERDEILAAARWARERLTPSPLGEGRGEGGATVSPRIGIVVPDLVGSRARVQRLFANVMGSAAPFNISLGAPLADYALVGDALLLLALTGRDAPFESVSRLVRSPFLAGAESEMDVRARLDARLRERCGPSVTLDALTRLSASPSAPQASILAGRLQELAQFRKSTLSGRKGAPEWAKAFSEALHIVGFPGERVLDSTEHQTLDKWHELLGGFATLERVTAPMGHAQACRRLDRMARDVVFQPEAGDVPVQVMGVLESAGLEFDHLWVMGLTDEAWPLPARPAAFIPVRAQRAAGIPQADPVSSLELDRRITEGWMRSAGEVVFSHARMKGESELAASPLIAPIEAAPLDSLVTGEYRSLREIIHGSGRIETIEDARAPTLPDATAHGGTRLFRDQGACPFRGFAHFRVESKPLEAPRPGLNARDRGSLVHEMLAATWKEIGTSDRLAALGGAEVEALLGRCADEAIAKVRRHRADVLSGRFAQLERDRLVAMTREWLKHEAQRPPFEVAAAEEKRPVTFGGITVNARLDRMDRLASGGHFILDYKSGACKVSAWLGERPDEPQVPMYAMGAAEDVAAVAFAQVKAGEMGFKGIGRAADLVPGVKTINKDQSRAAKQYRDWNEVVARWRAELDAIGRGYASGDARVDPKRGPMTCELCDQQMFCRIAEKAPFGAAGGGEIDE